MEYEYIKTIQGYTYWFITIFLMICLYAYIFYLYKSQRSGEVDYEKYSRLALDDNLGDNLVEERKSKKKGC